MPKSKRVRTVPLTQTSKKTKEHKASVISDVRQAIDEHDDLYLFSYENMRSNHFKQVRQYFSKSNSRIIMGKNKLLQIALGKSPEEEYGEALSQVAKLITGSVGLLFTSVKPAEVLDYFENLIKSDYARAGAISPRRVVITSKMLETHPVSMIEQFRKLGLPVQVENGRVVFVGEREEYVLVKEGETLSAEQCKALTHFGIELAEFRVDLLCRWTSQDGGKFEMLVQEEEGESDMSD